MLARGPLMTWFLYRRVLLSEVQSCVQVVHVLKLYFKVRR